MTSPAVDRETLERLPKVELHCHLDGAVRTGTILELAAEQGVDLPGTTERALNRHVQVPVDCSSLEEFLACFDWFMPVLSTEAAMERIARELCEDKASEHVLHLEARFAPVLQAEQGLAMEAAVEGAIRGFERGASDVGLSWGLILCGLRSRDPRTTLETVRVADRYRDHGVVGVDLAGNEHLPAAPHARAFREAADLDLAITIHAGEVGPAAHVREALDLGADRIGHGIRVVDDDEVRARVRDEGVPLEICPTSNLETGAIDRVDDLPVGRFLEEGIRVTLSTDDPRVLRDIDLAEEYLLAAGTGLAPDALRRIARTSAEEAFVDGETRERLAGAIETAWTAGMPGEGS